MIGINTLFMKISKYHTNRRWHNWLVYANLDRFLAKYAEYLHGDLVDLGCGEAPFKDFFLQHASTYTGVDWSNTMHMSGADVISDLNVKVDLESGIADSVVSLSVMEHLCEPQKFLDEAYRILKNDGYIVLQVPWQWWIHEAPHDYFRYTPYGLKYMFDKSGFKDVQIEPQSGFFTTWVLKINYFTARFVRGPNFLRWVSKVLLVPFWTVGQLLAPVLDKFDRSWSAEAQGYFVLARKG